MKVEIKGAKLVEIPFLNAHLENQNKNDDILIVGEPTATEGILQTVLDRNFNTCVCTDISDMVKDSPLENELSKNKNLSFVKCDFINFDESKLFDYIVCINVLEHFGMNFSDTPCFECAEKDNDYLRWNHDLRGILKMITLIKKSQDSKIIITVPCGQPILSGDVSRSNSMPFLRRYDFDRIKIIHDLLVKHNMSFTENFYYSNDFVEWFETDISISDPNKIMYNNPYSPNSIWGICITHR